MDPEAIVAEIVRELNARVARALVARKDAERELSAARWNLRHLTPATIRRVLKFVMRTPHRPAEEIADELLPGDPWRLAVVRRILIRLHSTAAVTPRPAIGTVPTQHGVLLAVHALTDGNVGGKDAPIMAIKLLPDGTIEASTPEELAQMMALLGRVPRLATGSPETGSDTEPAAPGTWASLMEYLSAARYASLRQLLRVVQRAGNEGISRADLIEELEAGSAMAIGGWVGGVSKACKAAGVDKDQVLVQVGDKYHPGPLLVTNDVPDEDE